MSSSNKLNFLESSYISLSIFVFVGWQIFGIIASFDNARRIPSALILVALLILAVKRLLFFPTAILIVGLWFAYLLTALAFIGSNTIIFAKEYDIFLNTAFNYIFAVVLCNFLILDRKSSIRALITSLTVFCAMNWVLGEVHLADYQYERLFTGVNSNETALFAVCLLFLAFFSQKTFYIKNLFLNAIACFAVLFILATGSRTAFLAMFIIFIFNFLFSKDKENRNDDDLFQRFVLGIGLLMICSLMTKTTTYQRLLNNESEFNAMHIALENEYLAKIFGERAIYIANGWELFLHYPIFGCGYCNYVEYYDIRCHNEWLAQLCEGGTVGMLFVLSAMSYILFKIMKMEPLRHKISMICCFVLIIICGNGLFISTLVPFWIWIAFLSAEIYRKNIEPDPGNENM